VGWGGGGGGRLDPDIRKADASLVCRFLPLGLAPSPRCSGRVFLWMRMCPLVIAAAPGKVPPLSGGNTRVVSVQQLDPSIRMWSVTPRL